MTVQQQTTPGLVPTTSWESSIYPVRVYKGAKPSRIPPTV